jgi:hypothetical protein
MKSHQLGARRARGSIRFGLCSIDDDASDFEVDPVCDGRAWLVRQR